MPYIKPDDRANLLLNGPENAGELNCAITLLIRSYTRMRIEREGRLSYQTLNDVVGALDGAKVEYQRRIVAPFEDQAIVRNGDLYP